MSFDGVVRGVKDDDLNYPHDSQRYQLGARHFKSGSEYVYVYNAGGSSIGTGKYCVLQDIANSLTSGYSVTVTNASLVGRIAGVAQNTFTTTQYGFVMIRGTSLVAVDSGQISAPAGADLCLGTDGGFRPAVSSMSVGDIFGQAMNSFITTVGTSKARIFGSVL